MTIAGTTINDVTVTADLRYLTSDSSLRDGRIREQGLESNRFPQAKFVLTTPDHAVGAPRRRRDDQGRRAPATSPCTASPRG